LAPEIFPGWTHQETAFAVTAVAEHPLNQRLTARRPRRHSFAVKAALHTTGRVSAGGALPTAASNRDRLLAPIACTALIGDSSFS
jgi:hypothetical protein